MMKKTRKIFAIILSTAMLAGTVLSANASARLVSRVCPYGPCGQSNTATGQQGFCSCGQPYYTYVCTKCKTSYRVCLSGHYY